mmetsp:Transcript_5447/g.11478  ORF Transcript_5447/g.11478 Transcript_5447/m.11478 type:complete len:290 (-) Transcript_5447:504-1373(-)
MLDPRFASWADNTEDGDDPDAAESARLSFRSAWRRVFTVCNGYKRRVRAISVTDPAAVAATSSSLFGIFFTTCDLGAKKEGSQPGAFAFSTLLNVKLLESIETHIFSQFIVTLILVSDATFARFTGSSRPASAGSAAVVLDGSGCFAADDDDDVPGIVAVVFDGCSCCSCGRLGVSSSLLLMLLPATTGLRIGSGISDGRLGVGGGSGSLLVWVRARPVIQVAPAKTVPYRNAPLLDTTTGGSIPAGSDGFLARSAPPAVAIVVVAVLFRLAKKGTDETFRSSPLPGSE